MGEIIRPFRRYGEDVAWPRRNQRRVLPLGHLAAVQHLNVPYQVDSFAPPERPEPMWDDGEKRVDEALERSDAAVKQMITTDDIPQASPFQDVVVPFPER